MQNEFEKNLLGALTDYAGKKVVELSSTCIEYDEYNQKHVKLYNKIQSLLPKEHNNLIDEFDCARTAASSYEMDVIYLQGMKDAVKILKMMKVI